VKGNIAHANCAAGVTGLIKVLYMLRSQQLVPVANFEKLNPKIDFSGSPMFVNNESCSWDGRGSTLRTGVSSFGIGGTNAHCVLEEIPQAPPQQPHAGAQWSYHVLPMSAKSLFLARELLQPVQLPTAGRFMAQVTCPRVSQPPEAVRALQEHGACILPWAGTTEDEVAALPGALFGPALRAAGPPAEISDRIMASRGIEKHDSFRAHTDGHAYGDLFPDVFALVCVRACASGGANFLIDGYGLLDELAADPESDWVPAALEASPVVVRARDGRRALRCRLAGPPAAFAAQRVAADSTEPQRDARMLSAYHSAVERAQARATRVTLRPGEALIVDNYRMFHGRDPYEDPERMLWRLWIWTDTARGVPEGEVQSTPGNTDGAVVADCEPGSGDARDESRQSDKRRRLS
ncbi:unnamed protein product, partial [Prorocentrum cordatum]